MYVHSYCNCIYKSDDYKNKYNVETAAPKLNEDFIRI